ncbi:aminoglycoside phosphotransferase family protein, partial [Streptomyces sp. NPDC005166]
MYTASSSVSAPPRPLRPMGAGAGPYLAPHAGPSVQEVLGLRPTQAWPEFSGEKVEQVMGEV